MRLFPTPAKQRGPWIACTAETILDRPGRFPSPNKRDRMHAQFHKPEWLRIEHWLIWATVLAALLFFVVPRAAELERLVAAPVAESHLPQTHPGKPALVLPFTAADVVHYFSTVLEMSPATEESGARVFENYQVVHPEDRWRITIWTEGKVVNVDFTVGGDYGLSLAREFFESPLFVQSESESFYEMLGEARNAPVKKMPRFTATMTFTETTDLQKLVMRFSPRDS